MATQLASSGAEVGVRVVGVVPGSPAEAAGLRPGDVVASCGGAATRSARALQAAVEGARVGVPLELRLRRGGEEASLQVTPEDVAQRRPGRTAQRQPGDDEPGASTTPAPAAQPGSRARYGAPPMPGAGGGYRGL
jgi:membrane-associated protease RseP (regulator of RpoE activity)